MCSIPSIVQWQASCAVCLDRTVANFLCSIPRSSSGNLPVKYSSIVQWQFHVAGAPSRPGSRVAASGGVARPVTATRGALQECCRGLEAGVAATGSVAGTLQSLLQHPVASQERYRSPEAAVTASGNVARPVTAATEAWKQELQHLGALQERCRGLLRHPRASQERYRGLEAAVAASGSVEGSLRCLTCKYS